MYKGSFLFCITFICLIIISCGKGVSTNSNNSITIIPTQAKETNNADNANLNKDEHRINKEDIFITNHPLLENTPFYTVKIDDIKEKCSEELDISYSEESADGCFTYYTGDGIVYITREDGSLYSVILTNNDYEFGCGLKAGMNENEISDLRFSFEIYNKDEIGVDKKLNTYLLSFKIGLSSMFDFDKLYFYRATLDTGNEKDHYAGYCLGLMALMKDGKLIAAFTDWPNAN